jgi:hypothetical protein
VTDAALMHLHYNDAPLTPAQTLRLAEAATYLRERAFTFAEFLQRRQPAAARLFLERVLAAYPDDTELLGLMSRRQHQEQIDPGDRPSAVP